MGPYNLGCTYLLPACYCLLVKVTVHPLIFLKMFISQNKSQLKAPLLNCSRAFFVFVQDPRGYKITLTSSDCADGCLVSIWSFESCLGSKRLSETYYILSEGCREYEGLSWHRCVYVCGTHGGTRVPRPQAVTDRRTQRKTHKGLSKIGLIN